MIGDDRGSLVAGDNRWVDFSRTHDPCGGLVVCDELEAAVTGTPSAKDCLISASPRRRILLVNDLTAVVVSARCNGAEGVGSSTR